METDYRIKNFRAFGEDGASIHLAPLTILTGCNSSGKSSIAKSILLLDTFLSKVKNSIKDKTNIDFENYTLDFSEYPLNLLGRFNKVLNASSENGEIKFKYSSDNGLEVFLTFITKEEDILNRGYLKKLSIYKGDNEVFVSSEGYCSINTIPFFDSYIKSTKSNFEPISSPNGDFLGFHSDEYQHKHKVSEKTINWATKNNMLFNIPILNKLGELDKNNFLEQSNELFSKVFHDIPGLRQVYDRIAELFVESEYDTFIDFFKARATEWMSKISINKADAFGETNCNYPIDWSHANFNVSASEKVWRYKLNKISDGDERTLEKLNTRKISFWFLLNTLVNMGNLIGLSIDPSFGERVLVPEHDEWFAKNVYITKHYLWEDFKNYVNKQLTGSLSPKWSSSLFYVGSSRIDVKRLYSLEEKTDFSFLLKRYFDARRDFIGLQKYQDEKGYEPDAFLNKWLQKFGICDKVSIELDKEGLGVFIKLHKGNKSILLADDGYGITQLFSILLEIESAIQNAFRHFLVKDWPGQNYMYITDMHTDKVLFSEQTIIIEEPEIHLHPKFQSLLTDMFVEALEKYNIHFIVETHSEYLIRRLQLMVAKKEISSKDVSVIYVNDDGNSYNMGLMDTGKFQEAFGPGFFDEADNAAIELFDLTN